MKRLKARKFTLNEAISPTKPVKYQILHVKSESIYKKFVFISYKQLYQIYKHKNYIFRKTITVNTVYPVIFMCHKICDKGKCYIFFSMRQSSFAILNYSNYRILFLHIRCKSDCEKKNHHKLNGYTISFESTCTHLYMYQRMYFSAIINS